MLSSPRVLFAAIAMVFSTLGTAQADQLAPLPMRYFCASNPHECVAQRATKAQWNDELHALLHTVNSQVNAAIRPLANPRGDWKINPAAGDCNDYAVTKRSRLINLGVPPGSLRLAITATPSGAKHLILVVKTTGGDVVLDNLSRKVQSLKDSGYPVHAMSTANPIRWTTG